MLPPLDPVPSSLTPLPDRTDVVVIGGGIAGSATALYLAQRGVAVCLCEKGRIGAEQSGRNWGWVRVMGRDQREVPLSLVSQRLWSELDTLTGAQTGFTRAGIVYTCDTEAELEGQNRWIRQAADSGVESRLLNARQLEAIFPGLKRPFTGGLYTPGDARAEPQKAAPAMALGARKLGAHIHTQCAVRSLELKAGRISGVVTERGRIACSSVVLAAGAWSRLFCGNFGIDFPQLKMLGSVERTEPMPGGPEVALGASDFAFRKRLDGGYTIARRGASVSALTPDHFRLLFDFLPALKREWHELRIRVRGRFMTEWRMPKRWSPDERSPFEDVRTLDVAPVDSLLDEGERNLVAAMPFFKNMRIAQRWGGMVDATPDGVPVISDVAGVPGFFIASGFSGHGFGIGPGSGHLMADLVTGNTPIVDPAPFTLKRFARSSLRAPA